MASNTNTNPNPMQKGFETVSGITPNTKKLPYEITTADVEKFLTKKVNGIQAKFEPNSDPIEVSVYSTESSKLFVPFVVLLSMNAAATKNEKKTSGADPFFTEDRRTGGNPATLKKYIYELFQLYAYNKDDANAFNSDDWRRARGVSRQTSVALKSLVTPKLFKRNGETYGIYFVIDPIRVFYDMLRVHGDNRNYTITIGSWQKQDSSNFKYTVWREIRNRKEKGIGRNIADELNYRMRNGNTK